MKGETVDQKDLSCEEHFWEKYFAIEVLRPLSSHTRLVYPPLRAAAILEDALTRVHASSVAPVIMVQHGIMV